MFETKYLKPAIAGLALALAAAPQVASAEAFNGPYAGVEAGLGKIKAEGSILTGPVEITDDSASVGVVAGYRMPISAELPVVLGIEGNAGLYTEGGDARYGIAGIGGLKIGESALLYGRLGYAWHDGVETGAGRGLDGLLFGGGAEVALTNRISARAEYRQIDYNEIRFPDNSLDFTGHEFMVGVLFNF
jgi:outer membrane immunogenic protein